MINPYMKEAKKIRKAIDTFAENQTDEVLVDNISAFPYWSGESVSYTVGNLVQYNEELYRVIQPHTSQADWTPSAAVSLFVKISIEEIPEWNQPVGAHDAYSKGDKCWYLNKNDIYESDIDGNVWKPTEYGWHKIEN